MQELPVLDSYVDGVDQCRCEGGQPKNFARPCLLLCLSEASGHGYDLIERLRPFGFEFNDPAGVYKTLRQMEQDGLITSEWEASTRGPARRVYSLTSDGRDLLEAWAHTLEKSQEILAHFLARYQQLDDARIAIGDNGSQAGGRSPRTDPGGR